MQLTIEQRHEAFRELLTSTAMLYADTIDGVDPVLAGDAVINAFDRFCAAAMSKASPALEGDAAAPATADSELPF